MRITVEHVTWAPAVRDVSMDVRPGETVGLVGANGSGKSSLLRCVAGLRTPLAGSVRFDGDDIRDWPARRIARCVAFVEQSVEVDSDLRLGDVVGLGRTPYRDRWRGPTSTDRAVVAAAIDQTGLTHLTDRSWRTLSGGERQRAHLARALAQQPRALLLDEPTNHLDVRHQLALLELLAATDQTVLVALHDLALAARYCDRLVLLDHGAAVATGVPGDVLTPDRIRDVFGVHADVGHDHLGNLAVTYRGPTPERLSRGTHG